MSIADTISVNPVSKTLGALHPEAAIRYFNTYATDSLRQKKTAKKSFSKFFFASSAPSVNRFGATVLLFRFLFATIFIVSGCFIISGNLQVPVEFVSPLYFGLGEIIVGSLLAIGLLSRVVMLAATCVFGYLSVIAILSGYFDIQALLLCLGSLVFLTIGTGKYSCDFLIRKALVIRAKRKQKELREQRLSYRAYSLHNMR